MIRHYVLAPVFKESIIILIINVIIKITIKFFDVTYQNKELVNLNNLLNYLKFKD